MIRYSVSPRQLKKLIEKESKGWHKKAKVLTTNCKKKKSHDDEEDIWRKIKLVYMRLQGDGKCAYCERKMGTPERGKIEFDVEHFRPKGPVISWTPSSALVNEGVKVAIPPKVNPGYYLLPYNIFNYAASCKTCNSALKKNMFPVSGSHQFVKADPRKLKKEKPLLLYPIGRIDADPEKLIEFRGVSPRPLAKHGHARHRALVTIEFFELDNELRDDLILARAVLISNMERKLFQAVHDPDATVRDSAKKYIDALLSPNMPFTNCARSFKKLYDRDPVTAAQLAADAEKLVIKSSGL